MALDNAKNFAKVTVSIGYDAAATSIVLTAGDGLKLPTVSFNATWWNSTDYPDPADDPNVEIVRVTNVATDTLTVTRAQESTSASTKNTVGKTYKMLAGLTAKVINTDIPALITLQVETPTGSVNGSNTSYTVVNTPKAVVIDNMIYFGGGDGYTYAAGTITCNADRAPVSTIRSLY